MSRTINCCVLGDSKVGKSCMIDSYTSGSFPRVYKPTILDVYSALVNVGNDSLTLRLFDLSGLTEDLAYRQEIIKNCDVAVLCYSMASITSLKNVKLFWMPLIRECSSLIPVVLAGTQKDRIKETDTDFTPIDYRARKLGKKLNIGDCLECSALTQQDLKNVFDQAIRLSLKQDEDPENLKKSKCFIF